MNATQTPANPPQPSPPTPPPAPAKVYFYKELFSNTWYIGGKPVQFEQLDGNRGVLALDATDPLVAGLDAAAHEQVGGIVKISKEEFDLKKNRYPLRAKSQETLQVAPRADQVRTGKAFRPPPPQPNPESPAQLADPSTTQPAPAAIGTEDNTPQKPPEQPDFKTESGTPKFMPKTARAGAGKVPDPNPV